MLALSDHNTILQVISFKTKLHVFAFVEIEAFLYVCGLDVTNPVPTYFFSQFLDNAGGDFPEGAFACKCVNDQLSDVIDYIGSILRAFDLLKVKF